MKIAFLLPSLANKAPIIVANELVRLLLEKGHSCDVYYFDDICELPFVCSTYRVNFFSKIDFASYDIIHSHGLRPDLYIFFHKPLIKSKCRFVSTIHSYIFKDLLYTYNSCVAIIAGCLWVLSLYRQDSIVVLSENAKEYYRKWLPASKLHVAYNTRNINFNISPEPEDIAIIQRFKGESKLIGVNAFLSPVKGIDMLIKALALLSGVKLCIIGTGQSKDELMALSRKLEVDDRCLFLGYRADAYRYLPLYDVYAMPSRSEGFPLTLLEAAIYSKPFICSDIPIFRELLLDNEASFFGLEDINSLKNAISYGLCHNDIGNNLHMKYMKLFSPSIFLNRYLKIYKSR